MRNVFDQYKQPENQVTHALMTALKEEPALLRGFLDRFVGDVPKEPSEHFKLAVQSYPGLLEEMDPDSEDVRRKGLPDAWITIGDDWCLIIENKVQAQATRDQIERHLSVAKNRLGYQQCRVLVLTVRKALERLPDGVQVVEWREIYQWLRTSKSGWAEKVADFLVVLEGHMVERGKFVSGTLTAFEGIRFSDDQPYNYVEAKRLLKLISPEFRERKELRALLPDASELSSREAITGQRDDIIWDVLSPEKDWSKCLHLTMGLGRTDINAMLTVPNGIGSRSIRRLTDMSEQGFVILLEKFFRRCGRYSRSARAWNRVWSGVRDGIHPSKRSRSKMPSSTSI